MPQYLVAQYGDKHRYLVKALREIGYRITRLVAGIDDGMLTRPVEGDEWCIAEMVGFLRDSEREDLRALEAMLRVDGARIRERQAMHGPAEGRYREAADVADLMWDFATLREETVWLLRGAGTGWNHVGLHPFRGEVTVQQWVQEMNERDLDAMWRIQRAHDLLSPPGARHVTGLADL